MTRARPSHFHAAEIDDRPLGDVAWMAQQLSPLDPHARRDEQQSEDEHGGDREEEDQTRVRVGQHPRQHRDHQRDEHHASRVAITAPAIASG